MWWADTGNDLLKQRNAADDGWLNVLKLSTGNPDGYIIGTDVQAYDSNNATASSTTTFTNKTFDANGTGNSLSNVDVADLADGTDGQLITWNASGNPDTVAVGTSGQVLTSNGAGAAPTMQTVSASADTSLSNLTATGENKVCQAWVNFNGTGTPSIRDSHNVSSITDNATGNFRVNFSNSMANVNYSAVGSHSSMSGGQSNLMLSGYTAPTTSGVTMFCEAEGATDPTYVYIQVFGD